MKILLILASLFGFGLYFCFNDHLIIGIILIIIGILYFRIIAKIGYRRYHQSAEEKEKWEAAAIEIQQAHFRTGLNIEEFSQIMYQLLKNKEIKLHSNNSSESLISEINKAGTIIKKLEVNPELLITQYSAMWSEIKRKSPEVYATNQAMLDYRYKQLVPGKS